MLQDQGNQVAGTDSDIFQCVSVAGRLGEEFAIGHHFLAVLVDHDNRGLIGVLVIEVACLVEKGCRTVGHGDGSVSHG